MSSFLSTFINQGGPFWYNVARKYFTLGSCFVCPVLLVINAPFGRFTPKSTSFLVYDGIKSWIIMELVSPLTLLISYFASPLSNTTRSATSTLPPFKSFQTLFLAMYLLHYLNRALVSPLRTPSRSKSHIVVPLAGIIFNLLNGFLMGSYLSSPYAHMRFSTYTFTDPKLCIGLFLWAIGLVGNIVHDEILLNIRRKAKSKDKASEQNENKKPKEEHYAIPQGLLYKYVSYPNYFCEWVEWFGYALASSPFPFPANFTLPTFLITLASPQQNLVETLNKPASLFAPYLSPPYIFLLTEFLLMLPRAYRGHQWYKEKFGESYPKERKIVIPFVL